MIDEDTFYYSVAELSARLNKSMEFTLDEVDDLVLELVLSFCFDEKLDQTDNDFIEYLYNRLADFMIEVYTGHVPESILYSKVTLFVEELYADYKKIIGE